MFYLHSKHLMWLVFFRIPGKSAEYKKNIRNCFLTHLLGRLWLSKSNYSGNDVNLSLLKDGNSSIRDSMKHTLALYENKLNKVLVSRQISGKEHTTQHLEQIAISFAREMMLPFFLCKLRFPISSKEEKCQCLTIWIAVTEMQLHKCLLWAVNTSPNIARNIRLQGICAFTFIRCLV